MQTSGYTRYSPIASAESQSVHSLVGVQFIPSLVGSPLSPPLLPSPFPARHITYLQGCAISDNRPLLSTILISPSPSHILTPCLASFRSTFHLITISLFTASLPPPRKTPCPLSALPIQSPHSDLRSPLKRPLVSNPSTHIPVATFLQRHIPPRAPSPPYKSRISMPIPASRTAADNVRTRMTSRCGGKSSPMAQLPSDRSVVGLERGTAPERCCNVSGIQ